MPTDLTGLAGPALAAAVACTLFARRWPRGARAALAIGAAVLMLVPFGELSPAAYVRGATGDLSIASVALLLRCLLARRPLDARNRLALQMALAFAALALYPLALGLAAFDPYRLGFGDPWLVGALGLVALAAWRARLTPLALGIALALLAWAIGWYESGNLWDYLIDPLLSLWAIVALLLRGARRVLQRPAAAGGVSEIP
jgi:hypothetical protein